MIKIWSYLYLPLLAILAACISPSSLSTPLIITVTDLTTDVERYRDQVIWIAGEYGGNLAYPACDSYYSPPGTWAFRDETGETWVAASGFGELLRYHRHDNLSLVLECEWSFFEGPLGCGYIDATGNTVIPIGSQWYLDAKRIVGPDPFPATPTPRSPRTPVLTKLPPPLRTTPTTTL
ncbi:MAG: hypothetical protein GY832_40205 [Chloroflexi bacterium]|nr:hypothetical protein [Chloroflexota bacterium]